MTELFADIVAAAHLWAIASSTLLGLLIGAFYGYELVHSEIPPRYPSHLWLVGIAFIVVLAAIAAITDRPPTAGISVGRAILWTFTCGSIPVGRLARGMVDLWWLRHKARRVDR